MRASTLSPGALTLVATLAAGALATHAAPARAQSGADEATRNDLLREADQARRAGDHVHALERAERAGQIRMTVSLRAFLARELSALGRDAEALGHLELCEREGPTERPSRNRDAALEYCLAELPQVRARIAHVVVEVPPGTVTPADSSASAAQGDDAANARAASLDVRLDGRALHPSFWNTPYVVAPGRHTVDAESDLGDRFHTAVAVAPGATETVRVVLVPDPARLRAMRPTPVALPLMVAGGAVAVVGAGLWITSAILYSVLRGDCDAPLGCAPANAAGRVSTIQALDVAGPVLLGVGAAVAAVGAVLYVVTPQRGRRARRAPHAAFTGAGLSLAF